MRIGFFGGTFDPPHRGHAMAILFALQTGEVDRVLVVPTARHAFGKEPTATFHQRVEMCRALLEPFAGGLVGISEIEQEREGKSYTVDTIRELKQRNPEDSYRLLIGTDNLADLPKWREGEVLCDLAPPLAIPRRGYGDVSEAAIPDISSTLIRDRVANELSVSDLVPALVSDYIYSLGLYRS